MQVAKQSDIMGMQHGGERLESTYEKVRLLAAENAVVIFTISDCCMCHVVKQLLFGLGVAPTIVELDHNEAGRDIQAVLCHLAAASGGGAKKQLVPVVFVGGKFLGGIEAVMTCHISGSLVPLLKDAGALWL